MISHRFLPGPLIFALGALPLTACLSFNASLQDARVLEEDQSSHVVAMHMAEEIKGDRRSDRPLWDFNQQFADHEQLPYFGVSYHYRHGWQDRIDYGVSMSMGLSGVDLKKSLYAGEFGAIAIGAKILTPTLSIFYFESYFVGLPIYTSWEALEGLSLYLNPSLYFGTIRSNEMRFLEVSTGVVLGRDRGAMLEWSMSKDSAVATDFNRYRQFKAGYFWRTDKKPQGELSPQHLPLYPELGFAMAPLLSIGLLKRWDRNPRLGYEVGAAFGYSPWAETGGEIRQNFAHSNLVAAHVRLKGDHFYSLYVGLARRELGSTLETDLGWQRVNTLNYGLSFGVGQVFTAGEIDWLGLYLPCRCGPHESSWTGLTFGLEQKTPRVDRLLQHYEDAPTLQVARYRMYF